METQKAGCFLINKNTKSIALVYREKRNDYSFPKGHQEKGETIKECAIRETAEETKRVANIIDSIKPFVERYTTPNGENCVCHMFFATDAGKSDNTSLDTHATYWVPFAEVEGKLTYNSLKKTWRSVRATIETIASQK